ncbi:uncharacterized protein PGTG_04035 [Puccinia graminis f. sp. tritici CRL 75-36-700-3]|uniref:Acyltransferase MbtK/IucB-like conserved domain-containing protein n=1 Tax=Puccinia graminis f. sp. tritici (strain CRL 75-36-700-3 / race SCCL) TaxID=418459 RepID=E3K1A4_PUCGT|nr:uncharacterized protein PGTG_04035 [Puccinia graminis f. sp. tritici CRL 75-36-700-3]EFP78079.1 hypothetical protein PGTG_04035 [Puccinia graminis f. sp. tritici CRL 75-36-700-3]
MSSAAQLPRLRPPTFAETPHGLHSIRMSKDGSDSFKIEQTPSEETQNPADLASSIGYALWDIIGSKHFATISEFTISWDSGLVGRLPVLFQQLSLEVEGDPDNRRFIRFSRARWYQRHPIFSYPHKEIAQGALSNITHPEDSSAQSNPVRILQSQLPPPPQTIYERYVADLDSYFCLSIFGDSEREIDLLHNWLNDPRVEEYWKDAGDREFHVKWLRQRYEDKHVLPVLGSYRGTNGADQHAIEPFAYYEIYWAAEDKIARAYRADPFDRGIHMLVGSSAHRGPHRVRSWLPSLLHHIFSDDERTQRIVSEPDHRNLKMITYLEEYGFKKMKEFDMGHKIAAIMVIERKAFWENCPL